MTVRRLLSIILVARRQKSNNVIPLRISVEKYNIEWSHAANSFTMSLTVRVKTRISSRSCQASHRLRFTIAIHFFSLCSDETKSDPFSVVVVVVVVVIVYSIYLLYS